MSNDVDLQVAVVAEQYKSLAEKHQRARDILQRPLGLAEKILFSHLKSGLEGLGERGKGFLLLHPDRVAMQDATAQMALLQFIQSGKKRVAVPSTVHCDHLISARRGAATDLKAAAEQNDEVYDFLSSASKKYGLGFWGPGSGIIHQVVFENYAYPGALLIGTDSHTPNGGGLGMLAIGVGGADAVDVLAGQAWELLRPKLIGIRLSGSLAPWAASKDIILKALEMLTVKGGTNKVVEYIGPGAESLSSTGKGTICNMGAELGATSSLFAYDEAMGDYLRATSRGEVADLADQYKKDLTLDPEILASPEKYYDEFYEIDLDKLGPYIVGPHSPDKARPVAALAEEIDKEGYPRKLSACLIGSCTNSSYEDIYKAAEVAKEALAQGCKAKTPFYVSPGSEQIRATVSRDGLLDTLSDFGATVLANACGPCIGQWQRDDIKMGEANSIVTSFNRNFRGRNDANSETCGFITSPEMVVAYAASGDLGFNPQKDELAGKTKFLLSPPQGPSLPAAGFVASAEGYQAPAAEGAADSLEVKVSPQSGRLQLLAPFAPWDGKDLENQLLLVKVRGKCTTDHISPAGKWLRFRGHLDKISDNMLAGVQNYFYAEAGHGRSLLDGKEASLAAIARQYKAAGRSWVIVGDDNYGEGSSREHAAMSPRYLNVSAVIVKSFARIHETNLKKQGVLALTFENPADYDLVLEDDSIAVTGLGEWAPGESLELRLDHADGKTDRVKVAHSYNKEQIAWFKAGSALNALVGAAK